MNHLTTRRAFSLIELLVVILILAVVVAIIVPALGGARNAARGVSSRATLTQIANASSAFANDHQEQMPGYFSAEQMGHPDNANRGFTEMENVMLDLAGGIIDPGQPSIGGIGGSGDRVEVGPTSGDTVLVDLTLIGAERTDSRAYFTPDAKLYQTGVGQRGEQDHLDLPDMVDAWGTPILAWRRNQFGPTRIADVNDFAREASGGDRAWYYWNANAGFLRGETVGRLGKSQAAGSMIGGGSTDRVESLMGFLGSPAYPADLNPSGGYQRVLPGAARGNLVLHSAGPSGVFLAKDSRGAKQFQGDAIKYYRNFFSSREGEPLKGRDGQNETEDLLRAFDDLIQTGN